MLIANYHNSMKKITSTCHGFVKKIWFPPTLLILAMLDVFLIFIPADGIMISSSMLLPKRWLSFALHLAIGSTFGAILLVLIVQNFGHEQLIYFFPRIDQSEIWKWTQHFFQHYGIIVLFIVGLTPFSQQPALILSALSEHSIIGMGVAILTSRIIKFSIMAYVATHAPKYVSKFLGEKSELKDSGIRID